MGRVYEALKRAAEHGVEDRGETHAADAAGAPRPVGANGNGHAEARAVDLAAPQGAAHAGVFEGDAHAEQEDLLGLAAEFSHAPGGAHEAIFPPAHTSASIEHTGTAFAGSALSGAQASRVAGATVDAVGSARAAEFPSVEISAARVEPHLVAITDPRSPHAEQYRSLRTRVLHASERRKLQALVVTSAGVAEGKTITALNLAWLLAQTDGVRAILVDGDLRNPCCADYLGVEASAGLSEVLAGEATLPEVIFKAEPAGLYLLPGGSTRDTVAEILSGPKFSTLLAELRRMFDYVIIDAPPLGIFTDATVLINRADSALVVVRSGKTRFNALDRVLEPLPRERLLGVVLNGADELPDESNYYYQRRYYKRREETEEVLSTKD